MSYRPRQLGDRICVVLACLLVLAGTAVAETVHFSENWEDAVPGDLCTGNPTRGWTCATAGALERIWVWSTQGSRYLEILACNSGTCLGETNTPNAYHTFTAPTSDYQVRQRAEVASAQAGSNANYVIYRLTDSGQNLVLEIGFKDADRYLDITSGSGWTETNYQAPASYRNYTVDIDPDTDTYDLRVWDGNTVDFETLDVATSTASSSGLANRVTLGSLSANDQVQVFFDDLVVATP
jgi:hypothetical protein